jgi:hypothetical protein
MAIINYGDLKGVLSTYMFHPRFVPQYDNATLNFEAMANRRLRVRPMETSTLLTTVDGSVALPDDYLLWRTVRPILTPAYPEIDYVHPAYLPPVGEGVSNLFTIEGNTFKVRPVDDREEAYELHYYQKIPTITGDDLNRNWLLQDHPDFYERGVLVELYALGRNTEGAQLYKAWRDEALAEIIRHYALTTGAPSPAVRTAVYF